MSVNHNLLPVTDAELSILLENPESAHALVEARETEGQTIYTQGVAITALMAEDDVDPLAFLQCGGPEGESGWVGEYDEGDGNRGATCQVDMGYGPASYYKNSFVRLIAEAISRISEEDFASRFDADWLQDNHVYPGHWHNDHCREFLMECFARLRNCMIQAARHGHHLLVWCD